MVRACDTHGGVVHSVTYRKETTVNTKAEVGV
jgi:hypothetical protein